MERKEVFVGGPTGGIPERVFHSKERNYMDNVTGGSGIERIMCVIRPWEIKFLSISDSTRRIRFKAEVAGRGDALKVEVQNRGYEGDPDRKHPDIYPEKLIRRSLEHFRKNGYKIRHFNAFWIDDGLSDNFDSYINFLRNCGQTPNDQEKILAALNTWSGQVVTKLGFTEITNLIETAEHNDKPAYISVTFSKPKRQNINIVVGMLNAIKELTR